jgi:uncharacterized protein YcbK (DUF882 family)
MVRRARALSFALAGLGLASVFSYSALSQAPASAEAATQGGQRARAERTSQAKTKPRVPENSAFTALPALDVSFVNTRKSERIRLYDAFGQVDEAAARRLDAMLGDTHDPKHYETAPLDRRTLQLMFRAAYHFSADKVEVVSAYRKPRRRSQGYHGKGQAIDFRLQGVAPAKLAAYLRTLPRVGVGIYTHPKTQFVHLAPSTPARSTGPKACFRRKSPSNPDLRYGTRVKEVRLADTPRRSLVAANSQ